MTKAASVLPADALPFEVAPAHIQLDGYYIRELRCAVRADFDEEAKFAMGTGLHVQQSGIMLCPPLTTNLVIESGQNKKDPSKFRVVLQIESNEEEEQTPYTFDIHLVGYFSLRDAKPPPFAGMELEMYRNAVMILYSTAREVIASVTGRGPFPALILPTLYFDLTEQAKATIQAGFEAEVKRLDAKKKPRQLPPPSKKTTKKKTGKKAAKKGIKI